LLENFQRSPDVLITIFCRKPLSKGLPATLFFLQKAPFPRGFFTRFFKKNFNFLKKKIYTLHFHKMISWFGSGSRNLTFVQAAKELENVQKIALCENEQDCLVALLEYLQCVGLSWVALPGPGQGHEIMDALWSYTKQSCGTIVDEMLPEPLCKYYKFNLVLRSVDGTAWFRYDKQHETIGMQKMSLSFDEDYDTCLKTSNIDGMNLFSLMKQNDMLTCSMKFTLAKLIK